MKVISLEKALEVLAGLRDHEDMDEAVIIAEGIKEGSSIIQLGERHSLRKRMKELLEYMYNPGDTIKEKCKQALKSLTICLVARKLTALLLCKLLY